MLISDLLVMPFLLAITWLLLKLLNRNYFIFALCKRVRTQDGSPLESKIAVLPGKTSFGNTFDKLKTANVFNYVRDSYVKSKGRNYLWYYFFTPVYNVVRAEDAEEIFQSTKLITKNLAYELVRPFLGDGLLISSGHKWHTRRKTLTPAFHFNMLQSFLNTFREESDKLVEFLNQNADGELVLQTVIPQFTLNTICETALGVNFFTKNESKQYQETINAIEAVMLQRIRNPLLYNRWHFYRHGNYRQLVENVRIAHSFSSRIIKRKREQFKHQLQDKPRYALLDTLLDAEALGQIDYQGICDEVNTFMFEGHDTTSTCLIFTLLMMSLHQDVQQRCYNELLHLPKYDDNLLSVFDFKKLVYLECVIKESLRMFPSVPFIGRQCTEETEVNGLMMPKGTQINIHIYDIMRDPGHFPQPDKFQPERFLPDNTVNRHPFAFVPFSAGQRNCIGQKFAILEMKVLLVSVLRNFKLMPVTRLEDIVFEYGIVLRSQQNVKILLEQRQKE